MKILDALISSNLLNFWPSATSKRPSSWSSQRKRCWDRGDKPWKTAMNSNIGSWFYKLTKWTRCMIKKWYRPFLKNWASRKSNSLKVCKRTAKVHKLGHTCTKCFSRYEACHHHQRKVHRRRRSSRRRNCWKYCSSKSISRRKVWKECSAKPVPNPTKKKKYHL